MKSIAVKLSALLEIVEAVKQKNMDFVEFDYVEEAEDAGERQPAFLNILGVKKLSDEYIVDFGSVDEIGPEDLRD